MLILQRKAGESLFIGDDIQVTVVSVDSGRVRLAIDAPRDLSILRSELRTAMDTNLDAAAEETAPQVLLDFLETMMQDHNYNNDAGKNPTISFPDNTESNN